MLILQIALALGLSRSAVAIWKRRPDARHLPLRWILALEKACRYAREPSVATALITSAWKEHQGDSLVALSYYYHLRSLGRPLEQVVAVLARALAFPMAPNLELQVLAHYAVTLVDLNRLPEARRVIDQGSHLAALQRHWYLMALLQACRVVTAYRLGDPTWKWERAALDHMRLHWYMRHIVETHTPADP